MAGYEDPLRIRCFPFRRSFMVQVFPAHLSPVASMANTVPHPQDQHIRPLVFMRLSAVSSLSARAKKKNAPKTRKHHHSLWNGLCPAITSFVTLGFPGVRSARV